jgi:8-amino-7-oxononanoate synthase
MCRSKGEQEHLVHRSRVDTVYSVDGTVTPLCMTLEIIEEFFPVDNANLVIDEAHATGLYVPGGRGMVALLGLVDCVLAQLPTLGKAPARSGGA